MKANIHVTNRTTAQKLTIHHINVIELIASHVYSMYFKRLSYIEN